VDLVAGVRQPRQVGHGVPDGDRGGTVEDEPHRALVGVLGDQDDGAPEVRVEDLRRGNEQLAAQ
jgi:hypothetical protein